MDSPKQGFIIKGYAKSSKEVIGNARIVLAPLRFGAGIKGKLTEAMLSGTPSITSNIGAEGMSKNDLWNGFVEDDFSSFATVAYKLYQNKSLWETAQITGVEIINAIYDKEKLSPLFIKRIYQLQENMEEHRTHHFLGSLLQHQTLQATKYMSKWIEEKNR